MIAKEQLRGLIPHAGDMCLLDAVEEWTTEHIRCTSRTHLAKSQPLRREGQLAALHLVEYAAQAMAIHGALLARSELHDRKDGIGSPPQQPQPGMLGALRDIRLHAVRLDTLTAALTVQATRRLARADGLVYDFKVEGAKDDERQLLCEGRIVVALLSV